MLAKTSHLTLDDKAKEFLVAKGFQPEMGARPLRRVLEQYLEDPLAEKLLLNPGKGGSWLVSTEGDKITFTEQDAPEQESKGNLAASKPSEN